MTRNYAKNCFGSVAFTARLEGLIPWFWAPHEEHRASAILESPSKFKAISSKLIKGCKRHLIIKGLERTGTGFCTEILNRNIENAEVMHQEKHKFFRESLGSAGYPHEHYWIGSTLIGYVICVRNPYSWLMSYEAYHVKRSRAQGGCLTHESPRHDYSCYINTWNNIYNRWLSEISSVYNNIIVRYEDLLEYPLQTVTSICSKLNVGQSENFREVKEYINNYSNYPTRDGLFSRRDYYLKKKYLEYLSPSHITKISSLLDKDLMKKLGYDLEP